jgi:hypothetical protein
MRTYKYIVAVILTIIQCIMYMCSTENNKKKKNVLKTRLAYPCTHYMIKDRVKRGTFE